MDWVQQTNVREASIIAFADHRMDQRRRDRFVRHTREVLRRHNVENEIWLVDPAGTESTPLTGTAKTRTASGIGHAIRNASYETIAVIDCEYPLDASHWDTVAKGLTNNNLQTWSYQQAPVSGYKKILIAVYVFLMRHLLGSKKHNLRSGFTMFRKSAICMDDLDTIEQNHPDGIAQLFCLSRIDHRPVIETQTTSHCYEGMWGPAAIGDVPVKAVPSSAEIRELSNRTVRFWWNQVMFPRKTYELLCDQKPVNRSRKLVTWSLLVVASLLVIMSRLDYSLFEPDEARNAQIAMSIVESGNWMSLTINNEPYWDKPPLLAWLTAASYKLFGINELATRLPAAICALITMVLMLAVGKRLVGFRAAAIGVGLATISSGFMVMSRFVTMDVLLTLCVTATMLCAYVAWFGSQFRKYWCVAGGIALGLGLLAKGPIAIVLTFVPLAVFLFLQERKVSGGAKSLLWFVVPALLVALPWYLATCWVHPEFVEYFFWKNHVVRFSDAYIHREPFWYYVPVLLLLMFPASALIPAFWKFIYSKGRESRFNRSSAHGFLMLYALWILAFFSVSQSKLPTYIMPAIVPLSLLLGATIEQTVFAVARDRSRAVKAGMSPTVFRRRSIDRLPKRMAIMLTFLIAIDSCIIFFAFPESRAPIWFMIFSIALCGLLVWAATKRESKPEMSWAGVAGLGLFLVVLGVNHLLPSFAEQRSIQRSVKNIQQSEPFASAPVVYFGRDAHAANMHIDSGNVRHFALDEVFAATDFLDAHPHAIVVSTEKQVALLREGLDWKVNVVVPEDARHVYLFTPEVSSIATEIDWQHLRIVR